MMKRWMINLATADSLWTTITWLIPTRRPPHDASLTEIPASGTFIGKLADSG
jgi:hypothetical protein